MCPHVNDVQETVIPTSLFQERSFSLPFSNTSHESEHGPSFACRFRGDEREAKLSILRVSHGVAHVKRHRHDSNLAQAQLETTARRLLKSTF